MNNVLYSVVVYDLLGHLWRLDICLRMTLERGLHNILHYTSDDHVKAEMGCDYYVQAELGCDDHVQAELGCVDHVQAEPGCDDHIQAELGCLVLEVL